MEIESERLILRDFKESDLEDLQEIFGDRETMRFCEPIYSLKQTKEFLQNFCISGRKAVAVEEKMNGKLLGYLLFKPFYSEQANIFEIGWWINRNYWRKGYAYEGVTRLIEYAFEQLEVDEIVAETLDNDKSGALVRKLGFDLDKIERTASQDNDGNWCDVFWYKLSSQYWKYK
ncbi:GNAT family N-acetyltransferase [Lactococcus protaetiae]|uniref:GNAT family N-acetyltransferase n=1 Tax=Lactococcus protaetiae TaxID=2592653 RepID=A0A514ZAJ6_9LACT|nr:GNAT family N-acetyltransferase [Lactococcus protaetiae]QDK71606.1 GNAT family N-acetyltransferase [Lactococcus protaetiae]